MKVSYKEGIITIDSGVKAAGVKILNNRNNYSYNLRDEKGNDIARISLCPTQNASNAISGFLIAPKTFCGNLELENGNVGIVDVVCMEYCDKENLAHIKSDLVKAVTSAGNVYEQINTELVALMEQQEAVASNDFEGFEA